MFALLDAIDSACRFLPDSARMGAYGLLIGVLAMLIYRWTSPQKRLAALKVEMADARKAMRSYTGTDAREMFRLSFGSVKPALRQLLLVLGPTLLAVVPVLLVVVWLEARYSYRLPNSGDQVAVTVMPPTASVYWSPADAVAESGPSGRSVIRWPGNGERVQLLDSTMKAELLNLPLKRPAHSMARLQWWDRLLDAGQHELPADASVASVEFDLPARHVWSIGPGWMRTWHTPFMLALTVAALGMKFAFKIH